MSTAWTLAMSEMVMSCVPGLFMVPITVTSPAFTRSVVTTPSMGARTVVLESVSREAFRPARVCSTWLCRDSKSARAVSSAERAFWKSASEAMWAS